MEKRDARGWISRNINYAGVQARMKVGQKNLSKSFSFAAYGGPEGAEQAAQDWLREHSEKRPTSWQTNLRGQNLPHKTRQDLPPGVSLYTYKDKGRKRVRFTALWHDGAKPKTKTFDVGYADTMTPQDMAVARTAVLEFRAVYVRCRRAGRAFDPSPWQRKALWAARARRAMAGSTELAIPRDTGLVEPPAQ